MYNSKKVLVTGGTGMIGVPVVRRLLEAGAEVRVASLDDPSRAPAGVEFLHGNLADGVFCGQVARGMDYVFHLAGIKGSVGIGQKKAASFLVPNLLMNTLMMEAARQNGIERFLYTSSIGVYPPASRFYEDRAWDGSPHFTDRFGGWAKRMGELQAEAYNLEYGWEKIAIVRPANVYGPLDNFDQTTAMVIPALIRRLLDGENPLVVWGDGSAVRDFIYADDVAEGMLLALEKGATCTPINLGSGSGVSLSELVSTLVRLMPNPVEVSWDTSKPSGEPVRILDTRRAQEMLGFSAHTTLEQGLQATLRWYMENGSGADKRYNVFYQGVAIG